MSLYQIRSAVERDHAKIHEIYSAAVLKTIATFDLEPPSLSDLGAKIRGIQTRLPFLVLEVDQGLAGYAYASDHRPKAAYQWTVEGTIYIHPDFQGRGLGKLLYEKLLSFLDTQGVINCLGIISVPNDPSIALHHSLGFETLGIVKNAGYKHGGWRDVMWMQRQNPNILHLPDEPLPITPFPELESDGDLDWGL